eukprot:TRINITY_DN671_c0_g3_i1.p1 TRINITY_DN671_c0_g3~~TRINITY_DN671_c0_g3_i1.p1  ORF type:complete len:141 (-),score=41.94 TRINITY_DN671_c0_g3_i1:67-465(-)
MEDHIEMRDRYPFITYTPIENYGIGLHNLTIDYYTHVILDTAEDKPFNIGNFHIRDRARVVGLPGKLLNVNVGTMQVHGRFLHENVRIGDLPDDQEHLMTDVRWGFPAQEELDNYSFSCAKFWTTTSSKNKT